MMTAEQVEQLATALTVILTEYYSVEANEKEYQKWLEDMSKN